MRAAAKEFADDPCTSVKRANMVREARALLSAVTRLLCVADMGDVLRLLASLKLVRSFTCLKNKLRPVPEADYFIFCNKMKLLPDHGIDPEWVALSFPWKLRPFLLWWFMLRDTAILLNVVWGCFTFECYYFISSGWEETEGTWEGQ